MEGLRCKLYGAAHKWQSWDFCPGDLSSHVVHVVPLDGAVALCSSSPQFLQSTEDDTTGTFVPL